MKCFSKSLPRPRQSLQSPNARSATKAKSGISYLTDVMRKSFMSGSDESSEKTPASCGSINGPEECGVAAALSDITNENEWFLLQVEEPWPSPRSKHAVVGVGQSVFVVGGTSVNGVLGDVQGLWNEKLIVVGCRTDQKNSTVTVHFFEFSLTKWSTLRPKGEIPDSCSGHGIVQVGSSLVMFAGEDSTGRILDDLCVLTLGSLTWVSIQTTGVKPMPRKYHSMACYGRRYIWIYGGRSYATYYNDVYCLDLNTFVWSKVKTKGEVPSRGRAGHLQVFVGDKFYIVGGENRGDEMVDTLVFDIRTLEWSVITTVHSMSPLAHDGLSVIGVRYADESYLLAFGGHGTFMSCQMYAMLLASGSGSSPFSKGSNSDANSMTGSARRDHYSPVDHFQLHDPASLSSSSVDLDYPPPNDFLGLQERQRVLHKERSPTIVTKPDGSPSDNFQFSRMSKSPTRETQSKGQVNIKDSVSTENKQQTPQYEDRQGARNVDREGNDFRTPNATDLSTSRRAHRGHRTDSDTTRKALTTELHAVPANQQLRSGPGLKAIKELPQTPSSSGSTIKEEEELVDALFTVKGLQQEVHSMRRNKEEQEQTIQKKFKKMEQMASRLEKTMQQQLNTEMRLQETIQIQLDTERRLQEAKKMQKDAERRLQTSMHLQEELERQYKLSLQQKDEIEAHYLQHLDGKDHLERGNSNLSQTSYSSD